MTPKVTKSNYTSARDQMSSLISSRLNSPSCKASPVVLRKRQSHRVSANSSHSPQRCGCWRGFSTLPLHCLTSLTHTLTAGWLGQRSFKTRTCSSPERQEEKSPGFVARTAMQMVLRRKAHVSVYCASASLSSCLQVGSCPREDTRCHTPHWLRASTPSTPAAGAQLPASCPGHPPTNLEEGHRGAPSIQLVPSALSTPHLERHTELGKDSCAQAPGPSRGIHQLNF